MDPALVNESSGIAALGIDWRALGWQVLNFAVLLGLLRAFAYRPILAMLERRRQTIEESLKNAATIAAEKAALEQAKRAIVAEARQAAQKIVSGGEERAAQLVAEAEDKARRRAEQLLAQSEAQLRHQVQTVRDELRAEVIDLVVAATEKIINVKLDPKKDAELIAAAMAEATH